MQQPRRATIRHRRQPHVRALVLSYYSLEFARAAGAPVPDTRSERALRGFTGNTFLGFSRYLGDYSGEHDTGFRAGTAVGTRLGKLFSLTGELATDLVRDGIAFDLSIVGTFSIPVGAVDLQLTSRLGGFFAGERGRSLWARQRAGPLLGLGVGAAFHADRRLALGPLLVIDRHFVERSCVDDGFGTQCTNDVPRDADGTVVRLAFALWY